MDSLKRHPLGCSNKPSAGRCHKSDTHQKTVLWDTESRSHEKVFQNLLRRHLRGSARESPMGRCRAS